MSASALRFVGIEEDDLPDNAGLLMTEERGFRAPARLAGVRHVVGTVAALVLLAVGAAVVKRPKQAAGTLDRAVQLQAYGGALAGAFPMDAYPSPAPAFAGGAGVAPAPAAIGGNGQMPGQQVYGQPPPQQAAPFLPPPPAAQAPPAAPPAEVAPPPAAPPGTCSGPGEDCRATKCCDADKGGSGMTCFEKDATWASCTDHCDKDDPADKWSCGELGPKTKMSAGCGWAGDDCSQDNLCCNRGFLCVKKDENFIGCTQTKKYDTWVTKEIPIPDGWDGTIVGPGRDEYEVGPAQGGQEVAGTSLYCFLAFLPGSYEEGLVNYARQEKASVFACDATDIFHTWDSGSSSWDSGETTITNTDVFINVWEQVASSGKFAGHDWTAKVDPDAVLLPDRLKTHIQALAPPAYRPIYLKNNQMDKGMGNNGFLGAVEVFSKQAVMVYTDNAEGCHKSLGVDAGEDGFFKGCMDALGVGFMTDGELFFPDKSSGACSQEQRAAFHPLKSVTDWQCCWDIINGKPHNVENGICTDP